jgi:RHS repeat-associated protein
VRTDHATFAAVLDYARHGRDADLGTVRMGARDYDPYLSQFWTPDPLFLEDLERCQGSPVECGLYGYAANDPLAYVDPSGLEKESCRTQDAPKKKRPIKKKPPKKKEEPKVTVTVTDVKAKVDAHPLAVGDHVKQTIDALAIWHSFTYKWNNQYAKAMDVPRIDDKDFEMFRPWITNLANNRAGSFTPYLRLSNGVVLNVNTSMDNTWRGREGSIQVNASGGASGGITLESEANFSTTKSSGWNVGGELGAGDPNKVNGKISAGYQRSTSGTIGGSNKTGRTGSDSGTTAIGKTVSIFEETATLELHGEIKQPGDYGVLVMSGGSIEIGTFTLYTFFNK